MLEIGVDFAGIGAFEQALRLLGAPFKTVFACDKDKYARKSYIANYGAPEYFPEDVYDRDIPEKPLNIYMSSPPCQAFSLSGKRKGEDDERGVLFYNTHEFIKKNKPEVFIIENVKGLLSHDPIPHSKYGRTFSKWLQYLAGKSINGDMVFLPHEDAVPYHIHFDVLNSKDYVVPQNRERVFIVGIRDDIHHDFKWPKKQPLTKKLKDVLEVEVDPKYFLSQKALDGIYLHKERHKERGNGFGANISSPEEISNTIQKRYYKNGSDQLLKIKSATANGYETATINDSINFSNPNSETRRGRVGKEVAQTLDTGCNQGVLVAPVHYPLFRIRKLTPRECLRLMDFPDSFKMVVSDTQIYKQAGNSIVRAVLAAIVQQLLPIWNIKRM